MRESEPDRRAFLASAATVLASAAVFSSPAAQSAEIPNYLVDLPAKTTLWGTVAFLGEAFIEVTVATKEQSKSLRGRFDGQRLAEFSLRNTSSDVQKVAIRATAVAEHRELASQEASVHYIANQGVYVGFGRRATPANASDRHGAYPFEAVVVAFILFGV